MARWWDMYTLPKIRHKCMLTDMHRMILSICSKNTVARNQYKRCSCINMESIENMYIFFALNWNWIQMGIIHIFQIMHCNLTLLDKECICYHPTKDDLLDSQHMFFDWDQNMHFICSFNTSLSLYSSIWVGNTKHKIIRSCMVDLMGIYIVFHKRQKLHQDYSRWIRHMHS